MMNIPRPSLLLALACLAACLSGCGRAPGSRSPVFFLPPEASSIKQTSDDGQTAVEYVVEQPYPASQLVCRVVKHLENLGWRALREDALNPGSPTGLVTGWSEVTDATRKPERRLHALTTEWLSPQNDLLFYTFTYEYPAGSTPDLSKLAVAANLLRADVVRAHLGDRADLLASLLMPSKQSSPTAGDAALEYCGVPKWNEFVAGAVGTVSPVAALPYELQQVRSIRIIQDIEGLGDRIVTAIEARIPHVDAVGFDAGSGERPEALLNFRAACRCKEPGAPDGFYIREVIVYTPQLNRADGWTDPPRVLFHWNDGGVPAWKGVASQCFGNERSASCREAFRQADLAFVDALASAIGPR